MIELIVKAIEEKLNLRHRGVKKRLYTYGLLTKREVKMAGYWLCMFMNQDKVKVHKHTKKE